MARCNGDHRSAHQIATAGERSSKGCAFLPAGDVGANESFNNDSFNASITSLSTISVSALLNSPLKTVRLGTSTGTKRKTKQQYVTKPVATDGTTTFFHELQGSAALLLKSTKTCQSFEALNNLARIDTRHPFSRSPQKAAFEFTRLGRNTTVM